MKLWSDNFRGNLHQTTDALNSLGISDVVAMDCTGHSTVVVHRISDEEYTERLRKQREAQLKFSGRF